MSQALIRVELLVRPRSAFVWHGPGSPQEKQARARKEAAASRLAELDALHERFETERGAVLSDDEELSQMAGRFPPTPDARAGGVAARASGVADSPEFSPTSPADEPDCYAKYDMWHQQQQRVDGRCMLTGCWSKGCWGNGCWAKRCWATGCWVRGWWSKGCWSKVVGQSFRLGLT